MRTKRSLFLVTMMFSLGCANGPALGAMARVQLQVAASDGEQATVRVSGRDCSASWAGALAREVTASHALENALDSLGRSRETVVYRVTATTSPGPEVCVEVQGWVMP